VAIIAYAIIPAVIDWVALLFHSAWILGLAIILAVFSYHHWQARQENRSLPEQLRTPAFTIPTQFGLALIVIGLAGTSQTTWETIIWIIILLIILLNLGKTWLALRSSHGN
jgi:small-conductance mechanosensitive channel